MLGLLIAAVGTLTSRVDVVLLALPLLITAAIGIDRHPSHGVTRAVRVSVAQHPIAPGRVEFTYTVEIEAARVEYVHLRVTPHGAPLRELVLAPRDCATVSGRLLTVHSGRQPVVHVSYRVFGQDGAWLTEPSGVYTAEQTVNATATPIGAIPLPHRLTGLTGTHASSRRGDGGEFRDLHPYAPGDCLRRIDWRATARRSKGVGDLYVRRTDATSDATVVLVIDSLDDVPELVAAWPGEYTGTSGVHAMDLSRAAAASLAVAAIGAGDRVGLIDLASTGNAIAPGGGKRHLERLLSRIADSAPSGARFSRRRAPVIPPGAIVYLLSTLLDDEVNAIALRWKATGHRVIWVDVLPAPRLDGARPYVRTAHRLLMAERQRNMAAVHRHGGECIRWQEDEQNPSRLIAVRALARGGGRRL